MESNLISGSISLPCDINVHNGPDGNIHVTQTIGMTGHSAIIIQPDQVESLVEAILVKHYGNKDEIVDWKNFAFKLLTQPVKK